MLPFWEQLQWRGALHSPKLQHHWNLTIRSFCVISRTLVGGEEVLPLCRGAVGVFYSPRQLGNLFWFFLKMTRSWVFQWELLSSMNLSFSLLISGAMKILSASENTLEFHGFWFAVWWKWGKQRRRLAIYSSKNAHTQFVKISCKQDRNACVFAKSHSPVICQYKSCNVTSLMLEYKSCNVAGLMLEYKSCNVASLMLEYKSCNEASLMLEYKSCNVASLMLEYKSCNVASLMLEYKSCNVASLMLEYKSCNVASLMLK